MTQIAKREDAGAVVQMSDSASLMEVISRAASDPTVDEDKMGRLLEMYERISDRNAKTAFHAALAEMQPELPVITERGEIKHGDKIISKYAYWEDMNEATRPVLHRHGFGLSFRVGRSDKAVTVTAMLSHREGHSEETTITLDADTSGSKNAVQAVGSSVSYGKRYAAEAILNITTRGQDDDGQKAGTKTISDDQKQQLVTLMQETGADTARFLKYVGVKSLDLLPAKDFAKARQALEAKRQKA